MLRFGTALICFSALVAFNPGSAGAGEGAPAKKGEQCAGLVGAICETGLTCEIPAGHCGSMDIAGTCVETPEMCTQDYRPVCDCDGKTHSNDCVRLRAGAQKDRDGECAKESE